MGVGGGGPIVGRQRDRAVPIVGPRHISQGADVVVDPVVEVAQGQGIVDRDPAGELDAAADIVLDDDH